MSTETSEQQLSSPSELAKNALTSKLIGLGFAPENAYTARFYEETKEGKHIFDHMVVYSTQNDKEVQENPVYGVFKLKRTKISNLDDYIEKVRLSSSKETSPQQQITVFDETYERLGNVDVEFNKRGIPARNKSAMFFKWNGRLHTFVLGEGGDVLGAYQINTDKIQRADEYFSMLNNRRDSFVPDPHYEDQMP